ncbi:rhodanese-like domain-containing protein [Lutibacter holmesii]|uniref:Rhodanese-like domain-containing protein n=1 Tax=Lutibacter holmesii TaxID=1137985 RepID=A0ABW3WNM5_9FLAO
MKLLLKSVIFIFLTISVIGCLEKKPSKTVTENGVINVITPSDFKTNSVGQVIIDVRTPEEFANGHIEGAININLFDKNFESKLLKLDKSKPVFIYCRSGRRTATASKKASKLGFENVNDLQGGLQKWVKNNYKITK